MVEADEIARWINNLAGENAVKRLAAASQLYSVASGLCRSAIDKWISAPEFRELLPSRVADAAGQVGSLGIPFVAGIAVHPEKFDEIRVANGLPRLADVPADQDAKEFELQYGDGVDFDILTTRDAGGSGAIARYLQKFGEGIQQIEIYVTSVDRATQVLRTKFNLSPIYPATRAGADGTLVNFFLVPAPHNKKVLIELVELSKKPTSGD